MSQDTCTPPDSQVFVSPEFQALFPPDDDGYDWLEIAPRNVVPPLQIFKEANIPGKPNHLMPEHYDAFQYVANGSYNPQSPINTWNDIVAHLKTIDQKHTDANNVCMPKWYGKTDDRTSTFSFDMGNLTIATRNKFDEEMRRITAGVGKIVAPADMNAMGVILEPFLKCLDLYASPVGKFPATKEENESWRWMRAVAILSGLGLDAFRVVAAELAIKSNQTIWAEFAVLSEAELNKLFHSAWLKSGYSLTTLWLDFPWFFKLLMEENKKKTLERIPFIFRPLMVLHIFKHVRLRRSSDGRYYLFAAYRGRYQRIYISDGALHLSLAETLNANAAKALGNSLQIDHGVGAKTRTRLQDVARTVLKDITPIMLARPLDITIRPEILISTAVSISRVNEDDDYGWIIPGIAISDFATVNLITGGVNKNVVATGADVLTYAWPDGEHDHQDSAGWRAELPDQVLPERPGVMIMRLIKNLNPLGHPHVVAALLDSLIYGKMLRSDLVGSELGSVLQAERLLVPILADDVSNMDSTTNIGKTTVAKLIAAINTPNVTVMAGAAIQGGPSQREQVGPIREAGTIILDDWRMPPPNKGFFSDQASLQTLTCGNSCAVGVAGANGTGVRLDQALYTTGKYLKAPPDIYSRSFMLFMTVLTDQTRNTDAELVAISTGAASKLVRIAALLYAKQHNLVEKFCALMPVSSGVWRFFGHATIAAFFLDGNTNDVTAYLAAATEHAKAQCAAAHDAAIDEEIGDTDTGFDPQWYHDNAADAVMFDLAIKSLTDELLSPRSVLETLVRNASCRSFSSGKNPDLIMKNEASCVKKFTNLFKLHNNNGKLIHPAGWVTELIPKTKSERKVNGKPVANIKVFHPDRKIEAPRQTSASDNVVQFPGQPIKGNNAGSANA